MHENRILFLPGVCNSFGISYSIFEILQKSQILADFEIWNLEKLLQNSVYFLYIQHYVYALHWSTIFVD